jgi:hypothetical protein
LQDHRTGADLVRQRRYAQINAFVAVAFTLPVQRLVLAKLLEQDHGQKGSVRQSRSDIPAPGKMNR